MTGVALDAGIEVLPGNPMQVAPLLAKRTEDHRGSVAE